MKLLGALCSLILDAHRNPLQEPERVLVSAAAAKALRAERECDPDALTVTTMFPHADGALGTFAGVPIFKDDRIAPALFRFVWRERAATA